MTEYAKFRELWPVLIIEAPEVSTYESIEYFCTHHDEVFKRRERFATIHDMTKMRGLLDARSRKLLADWTKSHEDDIKRWHVASATVVDNAIIRGIITAVHWFVKPPTPQEVTASMQVGVDFVVDHLRREGVLLSPKLIDFQRTLPKTG